MYTLIVNGSTHELEVDPQMPLLWVLRDRLGLTGAKYGCGIGACGACTVLIDGQAARSCSIPIGAVDGSRVTTIESIAESAWEPVQTAWLEVQVAQCGYCQAGMILSAVDLLQRHPQPSREQIQESLHNLCRCGTYQRVEDAIVLAATRLVESRKKAEAEAPKRAASRKKWRRKAGLRG